jgi:hypothetical protein
MNAQPAGECYGRMFPSVLALAHNTSERGKVLGYAVTHLGVVPTGRSVAADSEA